MVYLLQAKPSQAKPNNTHYTFSFTFLIIQNAFSGGIRERSFFVLESSKFTVDLERGELLVVP